MSPRTCEICRSRWFAPAVDTPYWAESSSLAALNAVCMHAPESGDGPAVSYLCATRRGQKTRDILAPGNNMYIGPSFTELDALNEIESMLVAIYHPLAQVWTLRPGQTACVWHVVNLQQKCHKFSSKLPPPPSDPPPYISDPAEDSRGVAEGATPRPICCKSMADGGFFSPPPDKP